MRRETRSRTLTQARLIAALASFAACTPFTESPGSEVPPSDGGGAAEGSPIDSSADVSVPPDPPPTDCYALLFDGVDDEVNVPDAPALDPVGPSTIEAWIRMDRVDTDEHQIVSHHDHPLSGYLLMAYGKGTIKQPTPELGATTRYYSPSAAGGFTEVGSGTTSTITPGKWTHIAATYDGLTTVGIWVDGVRKQESTIAPTPANANYNGVLRIGRSAATGSHAFGGLIDEVRISKVARYRDVSFSPASRHAPDLDTIALWHFDEGKGLNLRDVMNGHNGSINGPTWQKVDCISR